MHPIQNQQLQATGGRAKYGKDPKILDIRKIAVIILKFEQSGLNVLKCIVKVQTEP